MESPRLGSADLAKVEAGYQAAEERRTTKLRQDCRRKLGGDRVIEKGIEDLGSYVASVRAK